MTRGRGWKWSNGIFPRFFWYSLVLFVISFSANAQNSGIEIETPIYVEAGETEILPLPADTLPSDLENESTVSIDEIVLEKDSSLVIPPFRSIIIHHLISEEGARIQFAGQNSGGDAGSGDVNGEDASHARFFVGRIRGHVVIEARGGSGRHGRDGRHGRQGADGERGRNARTLIFGLFWLGDGERGRPGYPGENGEDGEDGGTGGNGGEVNIYYREKSPEAKILVDVSGGEAGRGGKAGIGGLGGNGGMGGRGIKDGSQGPQGAKGISGKPGRPGHPGRPGRAAVYQVADPLFSCLLELDARASVESLEDEDYEFCRAQVAESSQAWRRMESIPQVGEQTPSEQDEILVVQADGLNGEDASKARIAGSTPEAGTSGSAGGQLTLLIRQVPERAFVSARGGQGGNGADGAPGLRGADGSDGRKGGIFKSAKAGSDGANGGDGGNGSDGGNGADGGSVRVVLIAPAEEISDRSWPSRFEIDVSGGDFGRAGRGAPGGRGGLGGKGGKKFWSKGREDDGRDGIDGVNGVHGRDGQAGSQGSVEFFEADSITDWILQEFKAEQERFQR